MFRYTVGVILVSSGFILAGCQSLTPAQTAALACALASDGATVTAIYSSAAVAQKAGASATVACAASQQVGAILTPAQ